MYVRHLEELPSTGTFRGDISLRPDKAPVNLQLGGIEQKMNGTWKSMIVLETLLYFPRGTLSSLIRFRR